MKWQSTDDASRLHVMVVEAMDKIISDQSDLYAQYEHNARAYLNRPVAGFGPGDWSRTQLNRPSTYNVVRACVDTLTSNITLTLPSARILPTDAKEGLQEKGRKLEKLIHGVRTAEKHHMLERRRVRDAVLHGTGIIKVVDDGMPRLVRVHPSRVVVDDNAALDGIARTVYHYEHVDRDVLVARYGDTPAITLAKSGLLSQASDRDLVRVVEAHTLGYGDKPGRRVICTDAGTLADTPWIGDLPYSRLVYSADECGWHGVGLGEILQGTQLEIDKVLEAVRDNVALMAVPYWLVPAGTKIVDNDLLTNQRGRKVEYHGNVPPRVEAPPAVNPQVLQILETLKRDAFEISGISRMSASSVKPAGLESGIALLNLRDIETQRFAEFARSYEEESGIQVPRLIVQSGTRLKSSWSVKTPGKEFIDSISWSDCNLDDAMFDIALAPQSSLPRSAAGRAEFVIRLAEQQLIGREDLFSLLEMPDISKTTQLATAEYNDLERTFELMLETGEYLEPIEFQNLDLGRRLCLRYWSRGRISGTADDRLDLLVRWMRDAREIEDDAQMPPEQPQPALMPPGGAAPIPAAEMGLDAAELAL